YYTNNWDANRDHWVFSTQVESMNWVFMLDEAWRVNPNFWFEISTWDGNEIDAWMKGTGAETPRDPVQISRSGLSPEERGSVDAKLAKKSKAMQYLVDGQTYPPERAAGWVQFGLWLLRPRAVREFRGHATPLAPVEPYWMETVKAVDRVWNNEPLAEFWRRGALVANTAHPHPYQVGIPPEYATIPRWYCLDTNLDPPRPWDLTTNLPVFALALVLGGGGAGDAGDAGGMGAAAGRRWLVYAHAPLADRCGVEVAIPGFRKITVDVPRRGAFYLVDDHRVATVWPGQDRSAEGPAR
ncbi:MAG: hypothetical protein QM844_08050, partial [Planctomycetota bacterium]|nr:hypothetical protein [Planctomycetota bacterium]